MWKKFRREPKDKDEDEARDMNTEPELAMIDPKDEHKASLTGKVTTYM